MAGTDPRLELILRRSREQGLPGYTIRPEEGRFLQFLIVTLNARRVLEIGTLGGYSTAWMALALPPDGHIWTLERDAYHAQVARQNLQEAGLAGQVTVVEGEAPRDLQSLQVHGPFDLVFVDAEKRIYPACYHWAMTHLRAGGVFAAHNAYWAEEVTGILSEIRQDPRAFLFIYPSSEGLLATVKRWTVPPEGGGDEMFD